MTLCFLLNSTFRHCHTTLAPASPSLRACALACSVFVSKTHAMQGSPSFLVRPSLPLSRGRAPVPVSRHNHGGSHTIASSVEHGLWKILYSGRRFGPVTPPPLDALARVLTLNIMTKTSGIIIILRAHHTTPHHIIVVHGVPVLVEIVEFAVIRQDERIPFDLL